MIRFYFLFLSILLLSPSEMTAQTPLNDNCLQAVSLGKLLLCPSSEYSNIGATPSANEVTVNSYCSADGNNDRDVWFTFTTTTISDYYISVQSSGNSGILWPNVGIYRGDCSSAGLVKICADTLFTTERQMSVNVRGLSSNETYFIRVSDQKGAGRFRICITDLKPLTIADLSSNECSGILYDSGGPDMDYKNNENNTFTVCPKEDHQCIRFTLSNYNIETADSILFFNGPDTTAPLIRKIIGQDFNSGFNAGGAGFDVFATAPCLTIQFRSDSVGVYQGFYGKWLCSQETCPNFKAMELLVEPDSKTVEAAVARPGTQVKLTKTSCGNGKFNYGIFNATDDSNLGLGTGIVLSSGDIRKINQAAEFLSSTSLKLRGDSDLDSLSIIEGGSISKDACVMEFDVFANTDEINFEYIFGSEEYPEFISDPTFYDIFALMIDGPGISGDPKIAPKKNLAVLPDGTQISIGQVNSASNYEYYRNNFDGKEIVYNGLTTGKNGLKRTLTAKSKVIPCNTYHLKIAIADRGDENFDSGVFIGDIRGSAPEISFSSALGLENLVENCSGSGERIVFRLNSPSSVPLSFQVEFSGPATMGLDYETGVPSVITFPAGITELAYSLKVLSDNLTENDEYIEIKLLKNFGCGLNAITSTKIYLKDNLKLDLNIPNSIFVCNQTGGAIGKYLKAYGANRYLWSPEKAFSSPYISETIFKPTQSGWYFVAGRTESCTVKDSFYVTLVQPLLKISTADKTEICEGDSIRLQAFNNFGGQFIEWAPQSLFLKNNLENVTIKPKFSGQVVVKANVGTCTVADTLNFKVNRINMPVVTKYQEACYKDKIRLTGFTFAPDSKFSWMPSGPSLPGGNEVFIQALKDERYILKGETNGCIAFDTATVVVNAKLEIDSPDTVRLCKGTQQNLAAKIEKTGSIIGFNWKSTATSFSRTDSTATTFYPLKSGWIYAELKTGKCFTKDSIFLLVDSLPERPELQIAPSKPYYCEGDTLLLYSASMPVSLYPKAKFNWHSPIPGAISSPDRANLKFVAQKSALYIRKTENASCSRIDTFKLVVLNKLPEIQIDNDTICIGATAILRIKNANQYEKFEWKPVGSLSCTDCPEPTALQAGIFTVTATNSGYCPATKSVSVIEKGIRFTINAVKPTFCKNEKVETQLGVSPILDVVWTPSTGLSCTTCPNPIANKTGSYTASFNKDGCKTSASVEITQILDSIQLPAKTTICNDEPIRLIIPNDSLLSNLSISPSAEKSGNILTFTKSGTYIFSARTKIGNCPLSHKLELSKGSVPTVSISAHPDILSLNGAEVRLEANGSSDLDLNSFVWQDNSTGSTYIASPKEPKTNFILRAKNSVECSASDSISLYSVSAPTIFSPDSPTENALFKVFRLPPPEVADFKLLTIFDRWGNKVFETKNSAQSWNGEQFASDVYVYYLTFEMKSNGRNVTLKGDLTLIR